MAALIDIYNAVLVNLGQMPITSPTEDSISCGRLNQLFPLIRDAVLRAHPWNCALKRADLGLLDDVPAWGWDYQYQLPSDCLRVLRFEDDYDYSIEGGKLLTNESTVKILYVSRISEGYFDTLLTQAIIARLCAEIGFAETGSHTVAANFQKVYEMKLQEARSVDGLEAPPDTAEAETWLDARY